MEYFRFWNSKKALEGEEKEKKGKQKDKDYKGNSFSRKINSICKISWSIRSQMFFKVLSTFRNNHLKTPVLESENTWRRQKEIWHKCKIYPIWYNIAKDSVLLKKAAKMLGFVFSLKRVNYVIPMRNWWYKRADYVDCFKQLYIYPMKHNNLVIVRHLM